MQVRTLWVCGGTTCARKLTVVVVVDFVGKIIFVYDTTGYYKLLLSGHMLTDR